MLIQSGGREMQILLLGYILVSFAEIFTVGEFLTSQSTLKVCTSSLRCTLHKLTYNNDCIVVHWYSYWCDNGNILGITSQCHCWIPASR